MLDGRYSATTKSCMTGEASPQRSTLRWNVILTRRRTVETGAVLPPPPWFRTDGSRWCSLRRRAVPPIAGGT